MSCVLSLPIKGFASFTLERVAAKAGIEQESAGVLFFERVCETILFRQGMAKHKGSLCEVKGGLV